jgi:hypothetical protein
MMVLETPFLTERSGDFFLLDNDIPTPILFHIVYLYHRLLKFLIKLKQKLPQFSEMPVHRFKTK